MCLLILAHRASPQYPLLVAANRDEFHQRPTTPSGFWLEHPSLLAGRDEELGGTWMGVTREGKFAAVTNFRDPAANPGAPRSRGELPLDYLIGQQEPGDYLLGVCDRATEYAGFNLLLGDADELWYYSNSAGGGECDNPLPRKLDPGIYGLSNARLDTPWPKVLRGKRGMEGLVANAGAISHDTLLNLVNNTELAESKALQALGMDTEMEYRLSAQFIRSETYGTRSSTTFWRDSEGHSSWCELSFDNQGRVAETRREIFQRD